MDYSDLREFTADDEKFDAVIFINPTSVKELDPANPLSYTIRTGTGDSNVVDKVLQMLPGLLNPGGTAYLSVITKPADNPEQVNRKHLNSKKPAGWKMNQAKKLKADSTVSVASCGVLSAELPT